MIKEYCDLCGQEVSKPRQVQDPESTMKYYETVRYEIILNGGSDKNNMVNFDSKILCKDCMKKGYTVKDDEDEEPDVGESPVQLRSPVPQ